MTEQPPALPAPCHEDDRLDTRQVPQPGLVDLRLEAAVARAVGVAATGADPVDALRVDVIRGTDAELLLGARDAAALARPVMWDKANHTAQWFHPNFPGARFTFLRGLVVHTTETSGWPGYGGDGRSAPTLTGMPDTANKRMVWRQHYRFDESCRALRNPDGGVQTNTTNLVQVELIGTCASGGPGMFWPNAPDWALRGVAELVKFLHDGWGVPLTSKVKGWKTYPESYGVHNGIRFNVATEWLGFHGIMCHEHCAENDHGDAGKFPIDRLLKFSTPTTPGDDMPTLDELSKLIDQRLAAHDEDLLAKLVARPLGRSGPIIGVALQSGYAATVHAAKNTDAILAELQGTPPTVTLAERLENDTDDDPTD